MSILIKGMKLPSDCSVCPLETDYGTCGYYSLYVEAGHDSDYTKRRDDCPIIGVSTPHGDLIDRDELNKALIEMSKIEWNKGVSCSWAEAFEGVVDVVNLEIPIIEAEDGGT